MSGGRDADGVLKHAGEAVGGASGGAAIEAEDVFVEVTLQVLAADGAVVGSTGKGAPLMQPPLGEAEDEMDGGQALIGLGFGAWITERARFVL